MKNVSHSMQNRLTKHSHSTPSRESDLQSVGSTDSLNTNDLLYMLPLLLLVTDGMRANYNRLVFR